MPNRKIYAATDSPTPEKETPKSRHRRRDKNSKRRSRLKKAAGKASTAAAKARRKAQIILSSEEESASEGLPKPANPATIERSLSPARPPRKLTPTARRYPVSVDYDAEDIDVVPDTQDMSSADAAAAHVTERHADAISCTTTLKLGVYAFNSPDRNTFEDDTLAAHMDMMEKEGRVPILQMHKALTQQNKNRLHPTTSAVGQQPECNFAATTNTKTGVHAALPPHKQAAAAAEISQPTKRPSWVRRG